MRPGQVRDLAGILPSESVFPSVANVSALARFAAAACLPLPPCVGSVHGPPRLSRAAGRVLRGAPVSAVTPAQRGKTGSQLDDCAAHGAAQVAEAMWRARFSTASNGAPAQNGPCGAVAIEYLAVGA